MSQASSDDGDESERLQDLEKMLSEIDEDEVMNTVDLVEDIHNPQNTNGDWIRLSNSSNPE